MNYFEFYQIPICFYPNKAEVKRQFYALSKKYHPDFYMNKPTEKQNEALELATLNNKAYQALSNPDTLLPYVLTLKNVLVEGENYTLPQDFLIQMMELNETMMDLQIDFDAEKLTSFQQDMMALEKQLSEQIEKCTKQFDLTPNEETLLAKIKDLYYRKKYLIRIKESLRRN